LEHLIKPWLGESTSNLFSFSFFNKESVYRREKIKMAQLVVNDEAIALAKETAALSVRPEFLNLVEKVSVFETGVKEVKVTDDASEKQAVTSLGMVKTTHKDLEKMRKGIVAFPNKWVKTVNGMFKGLRLSLEKVESKLNAEVMKYRDIKRREIERAAAEAAKIAAETPIPVKGLEVMDEENLPVTPVPPEVPVMESVTKGENGAASFEKETITVEIIDQAKLVKAALDKRVVKIPFDLIEIKEGVLKRLVKKEDLTEKKWKQYGVKVTYGKQLITRTG